MKKNKIVLFVLALVLLAGIIVVCLKGFNISLDLRAHDTLKFVFDQKFKMDDVTKICDEVFQNKEYKVKTVEVFSDAIYVISPTITESEEEALLEKLDELYAEKVEDESNVGETTESPESVETGEVAEGVEAGEVAGDTEALEAEEQSIFDKLEEGSKYELYHDSKVRVRDLVKPYIVPSIICALVCVVYIGVKYRKLGNPFITICKTLGEMLIVLLEILSVIAITRIPFTSTVIPIVMFLVVICLCIRFAYYEKELNNLKN